MFIEVNEFVKQILSCFHDGYLWLGTKVPITINLISQIIDIPKVGVDPSQYFRGKDNNKKLAAILKNKSSIVKEKK